MSDDPFTIPVLAAALQELVDWANERDTNLDQHVKASIDRPLFHYTDSAVAPIILGRAQLRLTDYRDLKKWDKIEIEYGMRLARKIMARIAQRVTGYNWRAGTIETFCKRSVEWMSAKSMSKRFHFFIGCFTRHIDSPRHWMEFGRKGTGTAIGIQPKYFHPRATPRSKDPTQVVFAQPIVYSRAAAIRRQRAVIEKTLDLITRAEVLRETNVFNRGRFLQAMAVQMAATILSNAICTKRPCYVHESEIRVWVVGDKNVLQPYVHKVKRKRFIYTTLPLKANLSGVILGRHAAPAARQKVRALLKRQGYRDGLVSRSTVILPKGAI